MIGRWPAERHVRTTKWELLSSDIGHTFAVSDVLPGAFVSTERLGRRRGIVALVLDHGPVAFKSADQPTATCHLQLADDENALCGYEWEGLRRIPGDPGWKEFHPALRCDECSTVVDVADEDPEGRHYRHSW
jgi:hypothetical protein